MTPRDRKSIFEHPSRRLVVGAVDTGRWIERLITAGFAALLFLLAATLVGCLVWMCVYVWSVLL